MLTMVSTAGKWNARSKSTRYFNAVCWNYEKERCSVDKYPQQEDHNKIAANRKKFSEQKQNGRGTTGGNKSSSIQAPIIK